MYSSDDDDGMERRYEKRKRKEINFQREKVRAATAAAPVDNEEKRWGAGSVASCL